MKITQLLSDNEPSTSRALHDGTQPSKRSKTTTNSAHWMSEQPSTSAPTKKMNRQHTKRKRIRSEKIVKSGYHANDEVTHKHLVNAIPVKTTLDTANLPVAHGAYTALNKPAPQNSREIPMIQKIMDEDAEFQYIACDPHDPEKRYVLFNVF